MMSHVRMSFAFLDVGRKPKNLADIRPFPKNAKSVQRPKTVEIPFRRTRRTTERIHFPPQTLGVVKKEGRNMTLN